MNKKGRFLAGTLLAFVVFLFFVFFTLGITWVWTGNISINNYSGLMFRVIIFITIISFIVGLFIEE